LEPPNAGAELIDVTLGIDSSAICTWLADTDTSIALSSLDLTAGHLRPAATPVVVARQSGDGKVSQTWDIPNPLDGASYQVLPEGHLLARAHYLTIIEEDFRRRAIVYDPNGAIVSMGSFRVEAEDVRATGGGAIWVAHEAMTFGDYWRPVPGLECYSTDLELRWAPDGDLYLNPGPMSVLGDGVVFFDYERGAPYLSADESWMTDLPDTFGWVLHDPESRRWGFVDDDTPGQLNVTLGWTDFHGRWKPFSRGPIAVPVASPLEHTRVECDASSIHVWVGQRWYSVTLSDFFDESVRSIEPRLPDISSEKEEPEQ